MYVCVPYTNVITCVRDVMQGAHQLRREILVLQQQHQQQLQKLQQQQLEPERKPDPIEQPSKETPVVTHAHVHTDSDTGSSTSASSPNSQTQTQRIKEDTDEAKQQLKVKDQEVSSMRTLLVSANQLLDKARQAEKQAQLKVSFYVFVVGIEVETDLWLSTEIDV